jgi:hypothetical protein
LNSSNQPELPSTASENAFTAGTTPACRTSRREVPVADQSAHEIEPAPLTRCGFSTGAGNFPTVDGASTNVQIDGRVKLVPPLYCGPSWCLAPWLKELPREAAIGENQARGEACWRLGFAPHVASAASSIQPVRSHLPPPSSSLGRPWTEAFIRGSGMDRARHLHQWWQEQRIRLMQLMLEPGCQRTWSFPELV